MKAWLILAAGGVMAALAAGVAWQAGVAERRAGEALAHGHQPLEARLHGHEAPLPAHAARCINCHGRHATQGAGPLDGEALTAMRSRRNGPPGRYDLPAFCRALREGVDPVQVTLPRAMPLYRVSDAQCAQLWAYLTHAP